MRFMLIIIVSVIIVNIGAQIGAVIIHQGVANARRDNAKSAARLR